MLWVGGGQGAGKTTLSWHLSRAHDLPLHRIDLMPAFPFGCECGESGCRVTWAATPDDYAARTASGRRLIAHDIP